MLDEPLGALDRSLRRALLDQLAEIFARLNTPIIYVTHDHEEALAVGDRVAVMRAGPIVTVMPPAELWQRPPSEFVARFLGFTNVLDAEIVDGRAQTELGGFQLAPGEQQIADSSVDGNWKLLLRPDAFRPARDGVLEGVVRSATFRGDHTLLHVDVRGDGQSDGRLEIQARWLPVPAVGERVRLAVDPAGVVVLR
jgi:thiamine transport system ATP-binding protein